MLSAADYAVALIILLVPVGVGVWYAIKDAHRATRVEYLLGGRQMSVIPVAVSIFITFQSAISQIGYPAEVFFYGGIFVLIAVGIALSNIVSFFTIVPLMHPLQITSLYEYLKLRYKSETVRLLSTAIGMLTTVCYMAIALLSPALVLQASANLPLWLSIAVFGAVGTLYTAIGGFKSVVWTDVFQTIIVYIGIITILVTACSSVGGIGEAWRIAEEGGRLQFNKFTPDPRVTHTVWSFLIGYTFIWMVNGFNQSTLQRISSLPTVRAARLALLLNVPLILVYGSVLALAGAVIFAYFTVHGCDPFQAELISNRNQLVPYFVLQTFTNMPGMAGLYVSAICCGALSTLSSGINSLATNTVEDILPRALRSLREGTVIFITKLIVVGYGALVIGLAYLATSLKGPVTQMANSVFGACGSPILGVFLMGGAVPWANKYGALAGLAVSLIINLWASIGSRVHGVATQPLPPIRTDGCAEWAGISNSSLTPNSHEILNTPTAALPSYYSSAFNMSSSIGEVSSQSSTANTFGLYTLSFEWYSTLGTFVCIAVGLVVSYITNRFGADTGKSQRLASTYTDARYIFPWLRRFWGMEDPGVPCFGITNAELYVNGEQDGPEGREVANKGRFMISTKT